MSSWDKFEEPLHLDKNSYFIELNDENISDNDLAPAKNVCNTFKINNLGKYHDLYVLSECLTISELDPAYYLSSPGLSWQSGLKKTGVKLELLSDTDMLLLVENGIRGAICTAVHKYAKANNKYMKNYDSTKESTYLM